MIKALLPSVILAGGSAATPALDADLRVAMIGLFTTIAAAWFGLRQRRQDQRQRRQDRALDDMSILVDQLQEERDNLRRYVDDDRARIDVLDHRFGQMRQELLRFKLGTQRLVDQIEQQGLTPVWRPPTSSPTHHEELKP